MIFENLWAKIYAFLAVYLVGAYYALKQLLIWKTLKDFKRPDLKEKSPLALVTGGTKGIGLELVKLLVKNEFDVIIVGRNKKDGENALNIVKETAAGKCEVEFYSVDLSDLNQTKSFVETIKKKYWKLHLLVNNAALMFSPFQLVNGVELQWATNVVSPICLCESLMNLIERAADEDHLGRIINVVSSAMFGQLLTASYLKTAPTPNNYSSHLAYANSKVALAVYTEDLQTELLTKSSNVIVTCMHPGIITTDLYQYTSPINQMFFNSTPMKAFLRSTQAAAYDMLFLCFTDANVLDKGKYYENGLSVGIPDINDETRAAFREYVQKLKLTFK